MRIAVAATIVVGIAHLLMAQEAQRPRKARQTVAPTAKSTPQTPSSAVEASAKISVRYIELQVDANGKGSLYVDCQTNGEARITPAKGMSSRLASLDGAAVMRLADGRTEVFHDFATFANVEDLIRDTQTRDAFTLDRDRHGLVLKPAEMPGSQAKVAQFWYPRPMRLPVTLRMALTGLESDPFAIELQFRQTKYAKLNVYFFNDAKNPLGVNVSWFDAGKRKLQKLMDSDLPAGADVTYGFRCPVDADYQDPTLFFQRVNREMTIRELAVAAPFTARIGVRFVDRKGLVVVESVFEGPAAKAGLRPGDVVSHIDNNPLANADAAVRIVRDRSPGDTLHLAVSREGNALTIPVVAE